MTNLETIKARVKFYLRDVTISDADLENVILQTISDVANETHIFKKIIGFTIHEDKTLYDFRNMLRLNERVEEELQNVVVGGISDQSLLEFILNPDHLPDPEVDKTLFVEEDAQSMYINLIDIFDDEGVCISEYFDYHGTPVYYANDLDWLKDNDGMQCAYTVEVIPHIDELRQEDLEHIMSAIIEGCKYYVNDTYQTTGDTQVANLYYQRYWYKKQELVNRYPNQAKSVVGYKRKSRWP